MASATGHGGQGGPLGLRRAGELVLAGPAELAPGVRLAALVGEPCTVGPWRAAEARLELTAAALARAAERLVGRMVAGWPIEQVALDLADGGAALTLAGPDDDGWPALAQLELTARVDGGAVIVAPRRAWVTGPLAPTAADLCARVAERLADGWDGVTAAGCGLRIEPAALLRRALRRAGAAARTDGLAPARVRVEGPGARVHLLRRDMSAGAGRPGQGAEDMSEEPDDPLAGLRAGLRAGDRRGALAALEGLPALVHPGARRLTRALARVRAELLRHTDAGPGALRAWLAAAPDDPEAWWRLVVQRARAGDADALVRGLAALERGPGAPGAALLRRAAWATAVALELRAPGRAAAGLEEVSWSGPPEALAAAWRALALVRAADPGVPAEAVEEAVAAAEIAGGARPWCDAATLRARVAEAGRRGGRLVWQVTEETGLEGQVAEEAGETGVEGQVAAASAPGREEQVAEEAEETGLEGQVESGEREGAAGLAWFLELVGAGPEVALPVAAAEPADEARGAIAAVLADMARETGGIRAPGAPPESAAEAAAACALVEVELAPLRAALGLPLPVRGLPGGPEGGVTIRNDREPGLVVHPGLVELPAPERRFRVALAASLVRAGLAIVLDPQAASLPELLAALAHLADPAAKPSLPGARTIVKALRGRGWTAERLAPERREALARELGRWRRDRAGVARLARLLRRDALVAAARLCGGIGGGLAAIGRDARLLGGPGDAVARAVLATEEAAALLREAGSVAENSRAT